IAEEADAILAINGDFYGTQESGYVIRNNTLYRDTADSSNEDLVINSDGSFEIINESETSAESLIEDDVSDVLSFGPALMIDGEIAVTKNEEVGKAMASNPRTAIGQVDDLHYIFVVSDGRTSESEGLSLSELAYFMSEMGCETAYNLDGGGSSTMYFQGEIINNPTSIGLGGGKSSSKIKSTENSSESSSGSDSGSTSSESSNKASKNADNHSAPGGKGGSGGPGGRPGGNSQASDMPSGGGHSNGGPGKRSSSSNSAIKKSTENSSESSSDSSDVAERKVSDIVCIGE
ncbi:MAG: phosphodiester glycosidase family protein, partial [Lachnospiraceae bacterium]|nr:phosphodiester glycosidase family protein [Lachnospiraceae bacterium]